MSPGYQSATIENDLELLAQLPFPDIEEDFKILIRCSGEIRSGKTSFSEHVCFSEAREFTKLAQLFDRWLQEELLISPAKSSKDNVNVLLKYSIHLHKAGERRAISLFQHHGGPGEVGESLYFGAQKIISKSRKPSCHTCSYDDPMVAIATIDASGSVEDVQIMSRDLTESCKKSLARSLLKQEFIPAVRDGVAVSSKLVETFIRHKSWNTLIGSHCHAN